MSNPQPEIQGDVEPGFEAVRDTFAENFRDRDEIGASVCVLIGGRPVVDLWAGHADAAGTRPWQRDSIVNLYSTTKGFTALCAHKLVEQGRLDLDAPVAEYWPEFAAKGKERAPVRWLLSHRMGLPAIREMLPPATLYDWDAVCAALAETEPWWQPGSDFGYHPVTFGWLVGEVVRRIDGRSLGRFFREEFATPLGADAHIGVPAECDARIADIGSFAPPPELASAMSGGEPLGMLALAFINPMGTGDHNCEAFRRAEIPAINGHAGARGIARIYGALAAGGTLDGVRILEQESIERARTLQSEGTDCVMGIEKLRMGLGYFLSSPETPGLSFGPNPRAFGHPGAGGSIGFADPESGIGFGYAMNRPGAELTIDPRARALIDTLYEAL